MYETGQMTHAKDSVMGDNWVTVQVNSSRNMWLLHRHAIVYNKQYKNKQTYNLQQFAKYHALFESFEHGAPLRTVLHSFVISYTIAAAWRIKGGAGRQPSTPWASMPLFSFTL